MGGTYKDRNIDAVAKGIEAAVCDAALKWENEQVRKKRLRSMDDRVDTWTLDVEDEHNRNPRKRIVFIACSGISLSKIPLLKLTKAFTSGSLNPPT